MKNQETKKSVHIVTDSSCDLPQQLIERLGITVIPLSVHFGTETYADGELSPEAFWEKADQVDSLQTSQPSLGSFGELFERLISQGERVLCVMITGKHSGTVDTARLAAKRFNEAVQVFDSRSLSLGLGVQALEAARLAQAGSSMQETLAYLEELRERVHFMAVLDTLENVRHGGRADAFIAVADRMARMLNIKPIVNIVEGQVQFMGAARSFRRALRRVLSVVEDLGSLEHLAVVHARNLEKAKEMADQLAERARFPREDIWVVETQSVLATHAGMGAIGVVAVPRSEV